MSKPFNQLISGIGNRGPIRAIRCTVIKQFYRIRVINLKGDCKYLDAVTFNAFTHARRQQIGIRGIFTSEL